LFSLLQVIKSYHRILDLKEKHVDTQTLGILVRAINENHEDSCGIPASRLAPAAQKLFGRLTSQVVNHAQVWEIYAALIANLSEPNQTDKLFRVAQTLQKAYRSAVMMDSWEKDVQDCYTTLKLCIKFADSCSACLGCGSVSKEMEQLVKSAKLSLRSAISQVKRCYEFDIPSNVSSEIENLEQKVSSIDQMLSSSTSR
jgi:gas vesicle protein